MSSIFERLDQEVIQNFKVFYRSRILKEALTCTELNEFFFWLNHVLNYSSSAAFIKSILKQVENNFTITNNIYI